MIVVTAKFVGIPVAWIPSDGIQIAAKVIGWIMLLYLFAWALVWRPAMKYKELELKLKSLETKQGKREELGDYYSQLAIILEDLNKAQISTFDSMKIGERIHDTNAQIFKFLRVNYSSADAALFASDSNIVSTPVHVKEGLLQFSRSIRDRQWFIDLVRSKMVFLERMIQQSTNQSHV